MWGLEVPFPSFRLGHQEKSGSASLLVLQWRNSGTKHVLKITCVFSEAIYLTLSFWYIAKKKKYSASIDIGSQRVAWGTCLRWFLTTIQKAWSCSSSILEIHYIFRAPQCIFLRAAYTGLQTWLAYWKETYWYMVLDIFFKRLLRMIYIWFSLLLMICTRAIDILGYLSLW